MLMLHGLICWAVLAYSVNSRLLNRSKRHGKEYEGCDDGVHGISIDLHGDAYWKCPEQKKWEVDKSHIRPFSKCYQEERAYHVCIQSTIDNLYKSDIPHSGPHRKVWAQYGEYNYLPPGRYIHNLEHGGVVFMYHPCAPADMVNKLRKVATSCLYRYIMTAFPKLSKEYPFAVVTYGCIYRMTTVDAPHIKKWIRTMFGKSPEPDVYGNGLYNYGLLVASVEPSKHQAQSSFCMDIPEDNEPLLDLDNPSNRVMTEEEKDMQTTVENVQEVTEPFLNSDPKTDVLYTKGFPETFLTEMNRNFSSVEQSTLDLSNASDATIPKNDLVVNLPVTQLPNKFEDDMVKNLKVATESTELDQEDGANTFWLLGALLFLTCGTFTGLCLLKLWLTPNGNKINKLRVWSDNHGVDSFSVAAIVRKLPDSLRGKSNVKAKYHRIEEEENSSDDENAKI